jgi:hypothetical protein
MFFKSGSVSSSTENPRLHTIAMFLARLDAWKIEALIAFDCSSSLALVTWAVTFEGEGGLDTGESHKASG